MGGSSLGQRAAVGLIRLYRRGLSPLLGASCRFTPSCSAYTEEAILRYGTPRGSWLGLRRILRCHPFGGSGYDPVP
ncbi:MAG: membrane protein insertion efficiency factor YidD [Longimicrobiales bacterium]